MELYLLNLKIGLAMLLEAIRPDPNFYIWSVMNLEGYSDFEIEEYLLATPLDEES
jgi:hypothetical protein